MDSRLLCSFFALLAVLGAPPTTSAHLSLTPQQEGPILLHVLSSADDQVLLTGSMGLANPSAVGQATPCTPDEGFASCFQYSDYARLQISNDSSSSNCSRLVWTSTHARKLEDCFDLSGDSTHWYGGGETNFQPWPIEGVVRQEEAMVNGGGYGSVAENYWLTSTGVAIHAEEDVPLFVSWGAAPNPGRVCLSAQDKHPYKLRERLELKYSVCTGADMKDVHLRAIRKFYPTPPRDAPDRNMILRPFWSTWAQYHREVNQTLVLQYATRLIAEGFTLNSHLEVDDDWETCYGQAEFNEAKFPDAGAMVRELNSLGLKVTLWTHPFINDNCPAFQEAVQRGYLVKGPALPGDSGAKHGMISWWVPGGERAGLVDFTNPAAVSWWSSRLQLLKQRYGFDSFKFDVGEISWLPAAYNLTGDEALMPMLASTAYIKVAASFGGMVEVGSGRRTQNEPIFTRMLDKDSSWGYERGLRSLIPSLLHFGIVGYPFTLPDMIGGNAYNEYPTRELYIRWMQANAFMPAVQFSIVPWDFDGEVVLLCREALQLRELHSEHIMRAVNQSLEDGSPVCRPMWWPDPKDEVTFTIDDQYMLGEDMVVAPVVDEGATARDVYLPAGRWFGADGQMYDGPLWLEEYPAPLNVLPFFVRTPSEGESGANPVVVAPIFAAAAMIFVLNLVRN